jgi:hypothetical protein
MTDLLNIDFEPYYYNAESCLEFLRKLPDANTADSMDFHMYWKTVRPFGRKQILPIKSFIATQPEKFKLILWSNEDLTKNEYLKPWLKYIEFRIYNPREEAKDTILESFPRINHDDSLVYSGGDLFRALILHKHGGVYVDMDSVYLRTFNSLFGDEFLYKWSYSREQISSAVMYLKKRSELSEQLLRGITEVDPGGINWGCYNNMKAYAKKPFRVLPCVFFNPDWQFILTEEQKKDTSFVTHPFKYHKLVGDLSEGSFVWHWHNQWDAEIEPGCRFELYEKLTEERLDEIKSYRR